MKILKLVFVFSLLSISAISSANWHSKALPCSVYAEFGGYAHCTHESKPFVFKVGQTFCKCSVWEGEEDPCPEGYWDQAKSQCVSQDAPCEEKLGESAGYTSTATEAPGYESKCYSGCAVTVYEYFQSAQTDLWVIEYIYTGQKCSNSNPNNDPSLPPLDDDSTAPPPVTQPPQAPPADTDDDGIPDSNDEDIDGDDTPNGSDPDADGDGIDNENDPTPLGPSQNDKPGEEDNDQANVGASCNQTPSCSGNAIQCAQLVELWRLRCADKAKPEEEGEEEDVTDFGKSDIDNILGSFDQHSTTELNTYQQSHIASLENHNQIQFNHSVKEKVLGLFPSVTCSDLAIPFEKNPTVIKCSQTSVIRVGLDFLFGVFTLLALYHIVRQPVTR